MNHRVAIAFAAIAAAAMFPAMASAAANRSCRAGRPTPASYTWHFRAEASHLLNSIQADADSVRNHSDFLDQTALDGTISWQTNADRLETVREKIDDMGRKICRLEEIRRVTAPWQQQAIAQVAPQVQLMADNAEDAMTFVRVHEGLFWKPVYRHEVANLYHESGQVMRAVKSSEQTAKS